MSQWASIVVVGVNLNTALYNIFVLCIKWQYSANYYTCDFIECENVHDVTCHIILQSGNNIEILANPTPLCSKNGNRNVEMWILPTFSIVEAI